MSDTDPDLDRLQDLLNAIPVERDGMTVAELDGYVAALIVCPEVILPSEWLPGVWGGEHEFVDVAEAEATIAAVMEHYNRIARELAEHPEDYAPVFEIDPNSGETLWEPWIDGFERAMRLRPDAWEEISAERRRGGVGVDQHDRCPERFLLRSVGVDGRGRGRVRPDGAGADPGIRAQSERLDQVPAYRNTRKQCCPAPCPVRSRGADVFRAQGRPQRALPVRFRPEVQTLLRRALTGDRQRRHSRFRPAGHRERGQFVVGG